MSVKGVCLSWYGFGFSGKRNHANSSLFFFLVSVMLMKASFSLVLIYHWLVYAL